MASPYRTSSGDSIDDLKARISVLEKDKEELKEINSRLRNKNMKEKTKEILGGVLFLLILAAGVGGIFFIHGCVKDEQQEVEEHVFTGAREWVKEYGHRGEKSDTWCEFGYQDELVYCEVLHHRPGIKSYWLACATSSKGCYPHVPLEKERE